MKTGRGFTLIELLVVISIIGLLSSVVMASLNVARDRGRIGGARYFATQVDHIASEQAVGIWDFDECTGSTVADRSGLGNTGTLSGGAAFSTDTPFGSGCSVRTVGANQIVNVLISNELRNINDAVTVAGWVKYGSYSTYNFMFSDRNDVANTGGFLIGMYASGNRPQFSVFNSGGNSTLTSSRILSLNTWYHLTAVYDGSKMYIYVDGTPSGSTSYSSGITSTTYTNAAIGALAQYPQGVKDMWVDDLRVYSKALIASEVSKLYASEASRFDVAIQ